MRSFRIDEVDLRSECREIRVEGELDLSVAEEFRKRLEAASEDDVEVLVGLDRCDFIDSTGIAAIVLARKQITKRGRRLLVCGPSGQVRRILAVTGLDQADFIYTSAATAMAELFKDSSRVAELPL